VAKPTTSTPQDSAARAGSRPAARAKSPAAGSRPSAAEVLARRGNGPSITTFFQESRAELRKVTWPTRQEAMNLTIAVVAMTVFIAAFLGIIDEVLTRVIQPIIG
jgi:preprotein translocase subunit SecE